MHQIILLVCLTSGFDLGFLWFMQGAFPNKKSTGLHNFNILLYSTCLT